HKVILATIVLITTSGTQRQKPDFRTTIERMRHARQRRGVVIPLVFSVTAHRLAIGVEVATGEAVAGAAAAAGKSGTITLGIEGAATQRESRMRAIRFASVGKQLHHPTDGVGTIEAAAGATHDFGTLEHTWIE